MKNEITGPLLGTSSKDAHLVASVARQAEAFPDRPMVSVREGERFVDRSANDVWHRVRSLSKGLIASGVKQGDRVALMAATRVEWLEMDLAINAAGAITVPIYDTSSANQMGWILADSGSEMLMVETEAMQAAAKTVPDTNRCREVLVIDAGGTDELANRGHSVTDADLDDRIAGVIPDSPATIIYTSGTTGRPKGCILTHRNLSVNVEQVGDALSGAVDSSDTALLFLPLAHVLSKITALFCLDKGIRIAFATSIANLPEEFAMVQPSLISAVPRIFEKVYSKAQHSAEADHKGWIFERAASTAVRWSRQRASGSIRPLTNLEHRLFDLLVYRKIGAAFGGNLRMAFSGGAPLGERLSSFFDGIGIRIYEGYGLTETSPILTISRTNGWRPGTVGTVVAETSIRIGPDGEVGAKGPQVFPGYWQNDAATAATFDEEGWFQTGDVGEIDDDGFLRITGRKKELIITAAGKNVAPAPLEDQLRAHSLVSQAVVIGDGRPFIAALISIDEEAFEEWAKDRHRAGAMVAEMANESELREEIQEAVDEANASVSKAESIRKFAILPTDLALDRDELTPTFKVKRTVVLEHYGQLIESIYS